MRIEIGGLGEGIFSSSYLIQNMIKESYNSKKTNVLIFMALTTFFTLKYTKLKSKKVSSFFYLNSCMAHGLLFVVKSE